MLALDFRGFGESGGARFTHGPEQQSTIDLYWPGDVDAALAWLTSQSGVDKTRIGAAGRELRRQPGGPARAAPSGSEDGRVAERRRQPGRAPPPARLTGVAHPGAASHGDGGAVDQMRWVLGWSRNPDNKFVEYKAAGHGTDMFAVEKGLEPLVLDWFDAHLRNAPAKPAAVAPSKPTPTEEFWTTLSAPGGVAKARQIYDEAKRAGKSNGALSRRTRRTCSAISCCRKATRRTPSRSSS